MKNVFCTIISKLRVYQGIVLYRSLFYNTDQCKLYILCMDHETYSICCRMNLRNTILIGVEDIENKQLIMKKNERALNEYCWTLKPFFIEYVLKQCKPDEFVTYMDADMCFFNDPAPIYQNYGNSAVMLSEHDYFHTYANVESACGKYNSGFIIFKNEKSALEVLQWWQDKCLEWCYDMALDGKFGDQKYLDYMAVKFQNVSSIRTPGVNVAPWNEGKHVFKIIDNKISVDENKLICYHFSGFRIVSKDRAALVMGDKRVHEIIHLPYISVIKSVIEDVKMVEPNFNGFSIENKFSKDAAYVNL